jgi:hypothetical protein
MTHNERYEQARSQLVVQGFWVSKVVLLGDNPPDRIERLEVYTNPLRWDENLGIIQQLLPEFKVSKFRNDCIWAEIGQTGAISEAKAKDSREKIGQP